MAIRKDGSTAAAWLSSARAVGCSLKWENERNPYPMLYVSLETAHSQSSEGPLREILNPKFQILNKFKFSKFKIFYF